jgi:hypothetical protein
VKDYELCEELLTLTTLSRTRNALNSYSANMNMLSDTQKFHISKTVSVTTYSVLSMTGKKQDL